MSSIAAVTTISVAADSLASNSSNPGTFVLEEIIVNARLVEESIQSVPVTVTAFDSDALREATISSTTELQQAVPGILRSG
ncbi:hypothetical protein GCM10027217_22170 [Pseudomaricurvus hydrocarbonicus]